MKKSTAKKRGMLGPLVEGTAIAARSFSCLGVVVECRVFDNGELVVCQESADRLYVASMRADDYAAARLELARHSDSVSVWAGQIRARLIPLRAGAAVH